MKDIFNKAIGSVLAVIILGLGTFLYNEIETYKEIRELPEVKRAMTEKFNKDIAELTFEVNRLKRKNKRLESYMKRDSVTTEFNSKWVNYWLNR